MVVFDDNATTTSPTISVADVSPTLVQFNNSSKNYTINGAFGIAGTGSITKAGTGTLAINNANTYSGGTTVNAGKLAINNASAIGTGPLTLNAGATLDNTGASAVALTTNNAQNWNGDFTFAGTKDLDLGTGAVTMSASRALTVNAGTLKVSGAIAGAGMNLTKAGAGTLELAGNNTYNGTTFVTAGELKVSGGTTGVVASNIEIADGTTAAFTVTGGVVNANRVIIAGNGGNTTTSGTGTVTMTGGVINSQQWFTVGSGTGASAGTASGTFNISGGTLNNISQQMEVGNFWGTSGTVNLSGTGAINLYNNVPLSLGANNNAAAGTVNQAGGTVTFYSDAGTTVGGTGVLYLGRAGTSTGTFTYNLSGGTLTVPQVSRTAGTGVFNFNGGTLKASKANTAFFSGLSTANVKTGGAIIDTNGFNVTVAQPLVHDTTVGAPATDGGLTKNGAGTMVMSGVATYKGVTVINGGTLQFPVGTTPVAVAKYTFDELTPGGLAGGQVVANTGTGGATMNGVVNHADNGYDNLNGTLTAVAGKYGNGVNSDGSGSSIDIANKIVDQVGTGSWTFSAWVQTTAPGSAIMSKNDAAATWGTGDAVFYFGSNPVGTSGSLPTAVRYAGGFMQGDPSPVNALDGNWHMITYTSNAGAKVIYVDGVPVVMTQTGFTTADTSTLVRLGYNIDTIQTDGTFNLNGSLDEVQFYGAALTPSQVASLFATNAIAGGGQQYLPTDTPLSLTASGATIDLNSNNQIVGSLAGVSGSVVALGAGTLNVGNLNTSTTFAGGITGSGGLVKVGAGALTLSGASTYTGGTTISAGSIVAGAQTALGTGAVSVASGAKLEVQSGFSGALVLTGTPVVAGGGSVQINNSAIVVDYTGASPIDNIRLLAASGTLASSLSTGDSRVAVGFREAVSGEVFRGVTLDADAVLIKATIKGDATLDGTVNFSDLLTLAANYNGTSKNWGNGDFTYDGTVNFNDLLALAANYNQSLTGVVGGFVTGSFDGDWALAQSMAPEPTTLATLAGLSTLLLGRRRRD
ncbi:MAG: autotransporter-associated beta strand repeat-containing protein [Tepidisphaeraceae bacterium]